MTGVLLFKTGGQGLFEITASISKEVQQSGISNGICHLLLQHTSASLLIQENADPSAKRDLESWMNRLVPENDVLYTHTLEGPDDMPAHIKAALTACSLSIPVINGELALGTWQGIYIWEHRRRAHDRRVAIYIGE